MIKRLLEKKMFKKVHEEDVGVTGEKRRTYVTFLPTVDEVYITTENLHRVGWRGTFNRDLSVQKQPFLVTPTLMPMLHKINEENMKDYRENALKDFEIKYKEAKSGIEENRDLTKGDKATFLEELDKEYEEAKFNFGELDKEEKELLTSFKDFEFLGRHREGTLLRKAYFLLESRDVFAIYEVVYLYVKDKGLNIISSVDTHVLDYEAVEAVVEELDKALQEKLEKETK